MENLTNKRYEDKGFAVNVSDLIRNPCTKKSLGKTHTIEKPFFYPAPNGEMCLVTSHFNEWRMGWDAGLFNLIDKKGNVTETFEPLMVSGSVNHVQWTADSRYCMILYRA